MSKINKIEMKARDGFTLLELLAVIVIIGILASGIGYGMISYASNARYATAEKDLLSLKGMLDQYALSHHGTFLGLLPNGKTTGDLTGKSMISGLDKSETVLTRPISSIYDPWGNPYKIYADYNTTTQQGDIVIYVEADTASGMNGKDVTYKIITIDGTESSFVVPSVAINPNRKIKGGTSQQGEPMAIRILGQYEIM